MYDCLLIAKTLLKLTAREDKVLTPMQLIKLVYLSHGWALGLYGRPLIKQDVEAWKYGPVIPELYQAIKQYRSSPVKEISCKEEKIDERFIDVIDQVYKIYGTFTGIELSMLTHEKNSPWEITWNSGKSIISNDLIAYYYKKMNSQS